MSEEFLKLLNLSITASWLILAVILIRPLLRKAPKWINCALWALVAIRLVCPVSLESALSLIPSSETIPYDIAMQNAPTIDTGISAVNQVVNPMIANSFTPDPFTSANPLQILVPVASVVWLVGMAALMLYALISYLRLKKSVGASIAIKDNIMACDEVKSPFILGIVKPVIYVPSSMTGETLSCVMNHEMAHIKRHDHWWKPLGYLLLTVYWFNPLCWLAYVLLCRDIEMACDEKVIRDMDRDEKAAYSQALLNCNFPRKKIAACPLAFGEVGVKERVKSVLNYKKPAFWMIVVAVVACVAVAVCFLTNPKTANASLKNIEISWAEATDMRPNEPVSRDLNAAQIDELESRLSMLKIGKEDDDFAGQTPIYSLSAYSSQTGQFMVAGYDLNGNHYALTLDGKYYRIKDSEFIQYLSNICAGNDVSQAEEMNKWDCSVICVEASAPGHYVINYSDVKVRSQTGTLTFQNRNDFDIVVHILQEGEAEIVSDPIPAGGSYSFLRLNDKPCTIGVHADVAVNTEIKLFVYDGKTTEPYTMTNNVHEKDLLAGRYSCEQEGFGGKFTLTLNEDGTFQYSEGPLSSYIGMGEWSLDDNTVVLVDHASEGERRTYFTVEETSLVFNKDKSAKFIYIDIPDGTKFIRTSIEPVSEQTNGTSQIVYVNEIPENEFTRHIPKPEDGTIDYVIDDSASARYALFFKDITMEQSEAYIEALKNIGYTTVANAKDDVAIGVMLQKGNVTLSVACSDGSLGIQIIVGNLDTFTGSVSVVGGVDGPKAVEIKMNETYYSLTDQGKLKVSGSTDSNHSFVQSQMLWTNSTKISIKNNSGTDVTAYLFSAENESAPILEMTLSNKEKKVFTNLSSQYVYFVRIGADSSTNISVDVSD